ncbi:MAG: hypothetical protein ACOC8F_07490 [Planctomycetota bacterium]
MMRISALVTAALLLVAAGARAGGRIYIADGHSGIRAYHGGGYPRLRLRHPAEHGAVDRHDVGHRGGHAHHRLRRFDQHGDRDGRGPRRRFHHRLRRRRSHRGAVRHFGLHGRGLFFGRRHGTSGFARRFLRFRHVRPRRYIYYGRRYSVGYYPPVLHTRTYAVRYGHIGGVVERDSGHAERDAVYGRVKRRDRGEPDIDVNIPID